MITRLKKFYKKDKGTFFRRLFLRFYSFILMYPLIKIFIRFFSSEPNIKNWIIILSNYNSGSTLLKNILSNAQEIAFLPDESVLYSTQVKRPDEEFGWQRNWIFCEDKIGSKNLGRSNFIKFIYDISPVWVKSSKTIFFMDKTISNITRIQWFINNCENIKFLGYLPNEEVIEYIRQAKVVITATKLYEGQPRLLCEASSLGTVSIYPSFGGMDEFFPEDYKFSFEQFNYHDLTRAINLLEDKKLYEQSTKAVKDHILKKLNEKEIHTQFSNIINE